MKPEHFIRAATGVVLATSAAPAFAAIPAPEAGIGLTSMALLGVGYVYLAKRLNRR